MNCQVRKTMEFIYQKRQIQNEENNFAIEILEQDNAEKEKFVAGNKYLISSQDLKLKDEDITKWSDYDKIETLSKLINETKKKIIKLKPNHGSLPAKQHKL